jgi:hypothetical protein
MRVLGVSRNRGIVIIIGLVLGSVALVGILIDRGRQTYATLEHDLAKITLPSNYRLVDTVHEGTDCSHDCVLLQTWMRTSDGGARLTCLDASLSIHRAYSGAASESLPGKACEYYVTLDSFFHPDLGKRAVTASVLDSAPNRIVLGAGYGTLQQ